MITMYIFFNIYSVTCIIPTHTHTHTHTKRLPHDFVLRAILPNDLEEPTIELENVIQIEDRVQQVINNLLTNGLII